MDRKPRVRADFRHDGKVIITKTTVKEGIKLVAQQVKVKNFQELVDWWYRKLIIHWNDTHMAFKFHTDQQGLKVIEYAYDKTGIIIQGDHYDWETALPMVIQIMVLIYGQDLGQIELSENFFE